MQENTTAYLWKLTRTAHSSLEHSDFSKTIIAKDLKIEAYAGYLRGLAVIHACLERMLGESLHPSVHKVWHDDMCRLGALRQDLLWLRKFRVPDSPKAVSCALQAAGDIRLLSESNSPALLGCFYTMWGSTKGARILRPLVAESLGLDRNNGLAYLTEHADQGANQWADAACRLNDLCLDEKDRQSLVQAANTLFSHLKEMFKALWPLERSSMRFHVVSLNPEAGEHPAPQDPREWDAVLRASDRCLAENPYFICRFGDRGRAFTDSDGAWLATLVEMEKTSAQKQISWLAGVLAARGMPSVLLQRHLEILADELTLARPEKASDYDLLREAGQYLAATVEERLPADAWNESAKGFAARVGLPEDPAAYQAAEIMISAVIDEENGLENAVDSLLEWLACDKRFSSAWNSAAHDFVRRVRASLKTKKVQEDVSGR